MFVHILPNSSWFKVKDKNMRTMSGFLQMSNDGGRTWRKRFFVVHENGFLYSFKANQVILLVLPRCHWCMAIFVLSYVF